MPETSRIDDTIREILRRYSSKAASFSCGSIAMSGVGAAVLVLVTRTSGGSILLCAVYGILAFGAVGGSLLLVGRVLRLDGKARAVAEFNRAFPADRPAERCAALDVLGRVTSEHRDEASDLHDLLSGQAAGAGSAPSPDVSTGPPADAQRAGDVPDIEPPPKTAKPFKPYQPFGNAQKRMQEQRRASERMPYVPLEPDAPEQKPPRE
jgi:hypothetical protein